MTTPYRPDDTRPAGAPLTPGRVASLTAAALAVVAAGGALVLARKVLLVVFLAIVVGTVLCFPIDWMARRLPRWLAVLITLVFLLGAVTVAAVFVAPVVRDQLAQLPAQLDAARDRAEAFLRRHGGASGAGKSLATHAGGAASHALPLVKHAFEAGSAAIIVVVLAFFFASARDELRLGVRRLVPRRHEAVFDEWWARVATTLRSWVGGIFISMVTMGVITGVGLAIAGVDAPVLLGIVTFFGTFVPYLGAIVSALPGLAVALAQSPRHLVYALIVYVVVHHVEGYLVQPLIMRRAVKLQPALLLMWQATIGAVFGLAGVLVATPLLATAQTSVEYLWVERRLGKGSGVRRS